MGNPDTNVFYFMMTWEQISAYASYLNISVDDTGFTLLNDGNYYAVYDADLETDLLAYDSGDGIWGNAYISDYWTESTVPSIFRP